MGEPPGLGGLWSDGAVGGKKAVGSTGLSSRCWFKLQESEHEWFILSIFSTAEFGGNYSGGELSAARTPKHT